MAPVIIAFWKLASSNNKTVLKKSFSNIILRQQNSKNSVFFYLRSECQELNIVFTPSIGLPAFYHMPESTLPSQVRATSQPQPSHSPTTAQPHRRQQAKCSHLSLAATRASAGLRQHNFPTIQNQTATCLRYISYVELKKISLVHSLNEHLFPIQKLLNKKLLQSLHRKIQL